MEQATLLRMARLRTLAARKGRPFDVVRFASDREFAKATLKCLLETEDEELLVAGLQMMVAMDMTSPPHRARATGPDPLLPTPVATTPARTANAGKYIGRLR